MSDLQLTVLIPLYNEDESLPELHDWIVRVVTEHRYTYEILFIDDGSTDRSWSVIEQLAARNPAHVRAVRFGRNYGKTAALQVGFKASRGNVVITMDADLQDSPDEIPDLYRMLDQALSRYRAEVSRNPGIVGSYDSRPAQAVYRLLLAPIRAMLPNLTALTVVPPPDWQIPFEALETPAGRWLIQDLDVGYQFNLSGRLLPPDPVQTQHEALSFAPFAADTGRSPFRMPTGFLLRPLRASAEEATLPDGQSWLGKTASKKRFLQNAPHARLLLITTHTYPGPRETALVFHPAGTDYLLYPSELQHADLRAVGLAALSACATEKGIQLPGDGVHSLGRAMA